MGYIGNIPAEKYSSFTKQDFSTSATTSYTLSQAVANENEIALFINFVRQEPTTAYTASGTSLTLTSATSASDDMYCIYLGKAVQTVNPPSGSVGNSQVAASIITGQTALASEPADTDEFLISDAGTLKRIDYSLIKGGGITQVDNWRLTTDLTGNADPISSNLERVDDTGFGYIGSGMSVSSGIWTFPATGIYLVRVNANVSNGSNDSRYNRIDILTTTDNGTYAEVMNGFSSIKYISSFTYQSMNNEILFDVTNTSLCKLKFKILYDASGSMRLMGDTTINKTNFLFMRLGDT